MKDPKPIGKGPDRITFERSEIIEIASLLGDVYDRLLEYDEIVLAIEAIDCLENLEDRLFPT